MTMMMMMIFSDIFHYIVVLLRLLSLSEELATGCLHEHRHRHRLRPTLTHSRMCEVSELSKPLARERERVRGASELKESERIFHLRTLNFLLSFFFNFYFKLLYFNTDLL